MADQAQQTVKGAPQQAQNAGGGIQGATSGIVSSIEGWGNWIAGKGKAVVDRIFPPEQRSKFLAAVQSFMLKNPKLSAFLGMNFALTGIPLGLFVLFTLTVAIFSLVVGLVLGLLAAVLFTLFCVGVALTIVLPTVFFTTMAACFLFLWGIGGYYILQWGNKAGGDKGQGGGKPIGEMLNSFTGGRLSGFMDSAKAEQAKGDISGYSDQHTKPNPGSGGHSQGDKKPQPQQHQHQQTNGTAHKENAPKQQVGDTAHKATKATGVDGAQKTASNATGAVKGVSGSAGS